MQTYIDLLDQLDALVSRDQPLGTALSNTAALLGHALPDINWLGFYLLDRGKLWLAPFWGNPACVSITPDRGVCGAAFSQKCTLVVPDVHAFPGHIACDAASRSEIVVPLRVDGRAVGVLDVDSPLHDRFHWEEKTLLEAVARFLENRCDWTHAGYDLGKA